MGDREVHGLDLVHTDGDGLVDELAVMVRPMSGLIALGDAMRAKIEAAAAGLRD